MWPKISRPYYLLKGKFLGDYYRKQEILKLNLGSGKIHLPQWINIDYEPGADLVLDLTKKLPFRDNSISFIYSEHFFEHLTYDQGKMLLNECFRCMKEGGLIRIATPDLDLLIQKYLSDWDNQDWIRSEGSQFIKTRGIMMNVSFYFWGHKFIYNKEDLMNQLSNAGFNDVNQCRWGESSIQEFNNLETRIESTLILEGKKS